MERSAEEITVGLNGTWKNGKGQACCPAHDDKTPSLSIEDKDGKLLYHCHTGCSQEDLTHTLKQRGLLGDSAPPYQYKRPNGSHAFQVQRIDKEDGKEIWVDGTLPKENRPLYRLPELLAEPDNPALILEGEKSVWAAVEHFPGWSITCSQGGSNAADKTDWSPLKGRRVCVWPDHDTPGKKYAAQVAQRCLAAGVAEVSVVAVPDTLPDGWDVADPAPTDLDLLGLLMDAERVTRGLPVISWAELKAKPVEDVSWVVDGLLRRGRMALFCGDPKAGKSVTARTLLHAMVAGGKWLDREVQRGRVLYLALEENEDDIKEHLAKMNLPDDAEVFIIFETDPTKALDRLTENIADLKPDLVILDTLGDQAKFRQINDYDRALEDMRPFLDVVRKGNCALLNLHHIRKVGGPRGSGAIGSQAIRGKHDLVISLKMPEGEGEQRTVTTEGRGVSARHITEPLVLKWNEETALVEVAGTKPEMDKAAKGDEVMAALVDAQEPWTMADIKNDVGGKNKRLLSIVDALVAQGKISKEGVGVKGNPYRYFIVEEPKNAVPDAVSVPEQWEQNNFNDFKDLTPEKNAVPSVPTVYNTGGNRIISGVEEQADTLLNDVETDAKIQAPWWQTMPEWEIAPIDRTDPPVDGTATFHATRLTALLDERLTEKYATPEERAILDQHRMPYSSTVNAVGVMRQWTALQGCGVIALLFQPDGGVVYNQKEEAPL